MNSLRWEKQKLKTNYIELKRISDNKKQFTVISEVMTLRIEIEIYVFQVKQEDTISTVLTGNDDISDN